MQKFLLLTIFILILGISVQAQTLKGTIKTSAGKAIENATLHLLNTERYTISARDGSFSFNNLKKGNFQLSVSCVGYASQVVSVIVNSNETTITVTLNEQQVQLDDVLVSSEKKEEELQKTPIAVSVLNNQQLKDYRIWDVRDLEAVVPDLFVIEHAGSTGANFVNIRGVMGFTPEQSVATYIDGVYQFDYWSAPSPY